MASSGRRISSPARAARSGVPYVAGLAVLLLIGWGGPRLLTPGDASAGLELRFGTTFGFAGGGEVAPEDDMDLAGLVQGYCAACHNQVLMTANLALDEVDPTRPAEHPDVWEKVLVRLQSGTMPPPGIPRPAPETYRAITEWLEAELDDAWAANPTPNPGRISAIHRLNRTEYNNAVNDLLGLNLDVREQLPGDETADGAFDNFASVLTISPAHMEQYMSVARHVTRLAVGLPPARPQAARYRASDARPQVDRMSEDLPLGSRGGLAARHFFPVDGEYLFILRLQENYADYIKGMGWPQDLELRVDGALIGQFTVGGGAEHLRPGPHTYEGAGDGPGWPGSRAWEDYMQVGSVEGLRVRAEVKAGSRVIGASFPRIAWVDEKLLPQPPHQARGQVDAFDADRMGYAGVREIHVEGPMNPVTAAGDTPSRQRIFVCEPVHESEFDACAEEILGNLARRAYRRPVGEPEVDVLMEFFRRGLEEGGSFDHGIQFGLERMLVDPSFLLRVYRDRAAEETSLSTGFLVPQAPSPEVAAYRDPYPLTDLELASRLSFFLWSTIPDEALLSAAAEGKLTGDREVLRGEVLRLLTDRRAHRTLTEDFAAQWLNLRLLERHTLREGIYIDYDENLRAAMERETELFIESTIREDRGLLDLLTADYTYVNERLARHYGIPGVYGSHFRRVQFPPASERGGLLGHGSLLSVTSYPDRTTPVLRGKWLLENILGIDVPAPPPDVDTSLDDGDQGAVGSLPIKELLEQHRANPVCASCHAILDPMGFALEGYDAAGARRYFDEKGNPVHEIGVWPTGQEIHGLPGLREMLLEQQHRVLLTVTEKLMAYALGRRLEHFDRPAVRKIVRDAAADGYRWSSIVLGIVESPQFLLRAPATAE